MTAGNEHDLKHRTLHERANMWMARRAQKTSKVPPGTDRPPGKIEIASEPRQGTEKQSVTCINDIMAVQFLLT